MDKQNKPDDETPLCCSGRYGFPFDTENCKTCAETDRCIKHTHLVFSRQIRSLTRRSVTILIGGYDQGTNKTSVVTLPIRSTQIFLMLLRFAGSKKQQLAFLLDTNGNVEGFKTREAWKEAIPEKPKDKPAASE